MSLDRNTSVRTAILAFALASSSAERAFAQAPEAGPEAPASTAAVEPSTSPTRDLAEPTPLTPPPATDQAQPPQAAALQLKRPRRFAGTQLFQQLSASTGTFAPGQQLSYNPTVEASTFLLPRYTFSDFQLRGRLVFSYEITDSDLTTTRREPRFSDTTLQLFYRRLPAVAGFQPLVGLQVIAPTSAESRARTMYFSPGLAAQLSRSFSGVAGGELLLLGGLTYQHPMYRYTTPSVRGDTPYRYSCYGGGGGCDGQLSGVTNASDIVTWTLLLAGEWGKWSPAIFALGTHQFAYSPSSVAGLPESSAPSVRQSAYVSLWLDYNANSWFTAEVGYFMFRNVLSQDGAYGNPFFDRYQDARVYLGFNVNIDTFVKEVIEKDESDEAGIVRAKNQFAPARGVF